MRVHRRPRRRSRDSRRSSRSQSADEGYSYKARTASPRAPLSTTQPGSDISLESDHLLPSPFAHPEARSSTTRSPGWRPEFGPDQTEVEDVIKGENYEWLSPENVCPNMRQLTPECFQLNPGCPHLRSLYLKLLETNDEDPRPYVIEILAELPPKNAQSAPITSAPSEVPCAIRMNSKPILNFLASVLETKKQHWIKETQSMIISLPFKILVHYDSAIRNRCNELQQRLDLLDNELAQHSSHPHQQNSPEPSMEGVPGTISSEQISRIMASNATSTEPESGPGHHPPFRRKSNESIRPKSATQEGPKPETKIQSHTLLGPLEDDSTQRSNMKSGEKTMQHDTNDVSQRKTQIAVDLEHFRCIITFMDRFIKPHFEGYRNGVNEKVHFLDLWSLFQPGDYILWNEHRNPFRKRPRKTDNSLHRHSSWESRDKSPQLWKVFATSSESYFRPYKSPREFNLTAFRIDFDGTSFGPASFTLSFPYFEGERTVKSLDLVPLRYFEDSENLWREHFGKGKKFLEYSLSDPSFWGYKGNSARFFLNGITSPNFMVDEKEVDSRVIVDFREAYHDRAGVAHSMPELSGSARVRRLFDSMYTNDCFKCHDFPNDQTVDKAISKVFRQPDTFLSRYAKSELYSSDHKDFLGDCELRLLPDRVPAWILSDGRWGFLSVEGLRPVERDGALWSELRLCKGQKEAMLSLAQSHFQKRHMSVTTSTYTNSESSGVSILLTGPDGVGKTLAAKSLSYLLCKPFYRIMADSLGQEKGEIYRNLREAFARAERWDCVLLIEDIGAFMSRLRTIRAVRSTTPTLLL